MEVSEVDLVVVDAAVVAEEAAADVAVVEAVDAERTKRNGCP